MVVMGSAQVTVMNSHFDVNTNAGMVATDHAQVTVQGSTFNFNRTGDGALLFAHATVNLNGDIFASNGVRGPSQGLNGVEFFGNLNDPNSYSGAAVLSGNFFENNTAYGIFIGSATQNIQILNNHFDNNVEGVRMDDSGSAAPINATIQGNTIDAPSPPSDPSAQLPIYKGISATGKGVTATIGGTGTQGNTLENYRYFPNDPNNGTFIFAMGSPNLTIVENGNTFKFGGNDVPQDLATRIV
jgi:hypothetical protein